MPPPLEEMSDDESTGGSIPFDNNNHNNDDEQEKPPGDENEEDEDDEDEEGVYVVEQVVGHEFAKNGDALTMRQGILLLQVKWKGYDDPADQTLEPEENLMEGAKDVVEEYYRIQGGRPEKPAAAPKKRKSMGQPKKTSEKTESKRPRESRGVDEDADVNEDKPEWLPKTKNWEDQVESVDTICLDPETNTLCAYLIWTNGKKSKVSLDSCYNRCPKKMLKFYEEHL